MPQPRIPDDEPGRDDLALVEVLHALGDPVRLGIVTRLAESASSVSCSALDAPVSASTLTHHCSVLRRAGVIHQHYEGTSRMNTLRVDDLSAAFPGLLDSITGPSVTSSTRVSPRPQA